MVYHSISHSTYAVWDVAGVEMEYMLLHKACQGECSVTMIQSMCRFIWIALVTYCGRRGVGAVGPSWKCALAPMVPICLALLRSRSGFELPHSLVGCITCRAFHSRCFMVASSPQSNHAFTCPTACIYSLSACTASLMCQVCNRSICKDFVLATAHNAGRTLTHCGSCDSKRQTQLNKPMLPCLKDAGVCRVKKGLSVLTSPMTPVLHTMSPSASLLATPEKYFCVRVDNVEEA